jgi:hypothetical protein
MRPRTEAVLFEQPTRTSGLRRLGERLSRPVVAGDPRAEPAERDAGEVHDQRDGIERQRQRMAQPDKTSLVLPRCFPERICWEAFRLGI